MNGQFQGNQLPQNRGQNPVPTGQPSHYGNVPPGQYPYYGVPPQGGTPPPGLNQPPQFPPGKPPKKKAKGQRLVGYYFIGFFILIILGVLGAVFGYNSGVAARRAEYTRKSRLAAGEQFLLAQEDMLNLRYENVRRRLEYVLQVDPQYPGAREMYMEAEMQVNFKVTATPYYTPTPGPTATPDVRGEEEMFNAVFSTMIGQDWEGALAQMDALRDKNIAYRALDVDGLYYIALRNFGIQQVGQGYLESGVYKITLSEAFGPTDAEANNMRLAARSYLAGSGFWEIDWNKALEYYTNALSFPTLYDRASGMTAADRYAIASFEVAGLYIKEEKYCEAAPFFEQGFVYKADPEVSLAAAAAALICNPPATPNVNGDVPLPTVIGGITPEPTPIPDGGITDGNDAPTT